MASIRVQMLEVFPPHEPRFVAAAVKLRPIIPNAVRAFTAAATRFKGSRREIRFRGILTPALSPSDEAREFKMSLLTSAATKSGLSLPALIADTRAELSADPVALAAFNDRLLDRGWLDAHASRYEGRRWTVRGERTYQARRGFPRLVEVDLPAGVGDVNFAVTLAACESFAAPVSGMLKAVAGDGKKRRKRL